MIRLKNKTNTYKSGKGAWTTHENIKLAKESVIHGVHSPEKPDNPEKPEEPEKSQEKQIQVRKKP